MNVKKKLLILCSGNSCRSQMAHGYFDFFGGNNLDVYSAGIETHGLNPNAVLVMKEDGVDISRHTSNNVNEYANLNFEFVLTVCDNAKERCPHFPAVVRTFHHNFPDPATATGTEEQILNEFRKTRDLIKAYVVGFLNKYVNISS